MGCTINNDEIEEEQFADLYLSMDCGADYDLMDGETLLGRVVVTNNKSGNMVYFKFIAYDGFSISSIRSGFGDTVDDLPVNNGGVIPGKLDKVDYDNLTEVSQVINVDSRFVYAARVDFVNDSGVNYSVWVGDIIIGNKDSKYFTYTPCTNVEDIPCYVGMGKEVTLENSFVRSNLYGVSLLNSYYLNMLDEGVSRTGTFTPSIYSLVLSYKSNNFQTFTTKYTVTEESCSESVYLSITVTP